ncbi:MAG: FtsQ-type POTRA domain-containing protein [Ignavibacteria bacterium]|nr:FtsQ-type POTRA domain-containing protein [Ignavibacteria bacterium]
MNFKKIILLLIVLIVIAVAFLSLKWRSGNALDKITLTGNYTISREEIFSIARLNDSIISSDEINIDLIQDRISKHPEIKKAFVSRELPSEIKIEVIERRPVAILNGENEIKLIDDELEIFPFKNSSKLYDLPVISGVRIENHTNPMKKYNEEDLRLALFIILNTYKDSKAVYNNISEVNLSDTAKAVIYLSEDSSPFYFPRKYKESISNKEYQKLLLNKLEVFECYLKQSLDNHLKKQINYVDLRYENEVIVNSNN